MKKYTVLLSDEVAEFYSQISKNINFPINKVLSDSLFRFAGEMSLREISKKEKRIGGQR